MPVATPCANAFAPASPAPDAPWRRRRGTAGERSAAISYLTWREDSNARTERATGLPRLVHNPLWDHGCNYSVFCPADPPLLRAGLVPHPVLRHPPSCRNERFTLSDQVAFYLVHTRLV